MIASTAQRVGEMVVERLRSTCLQIEIAGSVRRRKADVKDVEIVAMPQRQGDLFGDPYGDCPLHNGIVELVDEGMIRWRNPPAAGASHRTQVKKFYALEAVVTGLKIDLFAVRPPAEWGAILAIRTGPADFSRMLVTKCRERGLRCENGRLVGVDDDKTVPTPTEESFFRACGVPWREPERR